MSNNIVFAIAGLLLVVAWVLMDIRATLAESKTQNLLQYKMLQELVMIRQILSTEGEVKYPPME